MVLWEDRHVIYKIGFCGLVLSVGAYVIGFSLPYWLLVSNNDQVERSIGLWQSCASQQLACFSNVRSSSLSWMNVTRIMCSVALLFFFLTLVCSCDSNVSSCGQVLCQSRKKYIELLAVVGIVVGLGGCVSFAFQNEIGHLHWAFYHVCAALTVTGICACVMYVFNQPSQRMCRLTTLRALGPNRLPVSVQYSVELGDERFHIPYFGDVTPDQLVYGATPTQPPSYEVATSSVNYSSPPVDASEAPPLYEDVTKDAALPPEAVAHLQNADKGIQEPGQ